MSAATGDVAFRDYGARGRFGLLTPQANPTVEPEFRRLMPADTELYVARLTSRSTDPRERLVEYLESLPDALAQYDTLPLAAIAFACTGSSYLLGADRESDRLATAARAIGAPVHSSATAIREALAWLGCRSVFVVSPYPSWLRDAGVRYWQAAGFAVTGTADVPIGRADTRGIYELSSRDAARVLAGLDVRGADALLLSGTGMPSLALLGYGPGADPLLRPGRGTAARPVRLGSNLALAWRLHHHVPGWQAAPDGPLLG
ncbi:MAG: hypothetical protein O9284_16565 [Steroidobacteraceae bacterium]|jgi:maleate isomerase|nr:hypothetical protein [Steroidobacteraceae bacterium]